MNYLRGFYGTWVKEHLLTRFTVSPYVQKALFGIAGASVLFAALAEIDRARVASTIELKKSRMEMVKKI